LATRRRASRNSITGTITDLQRRVRHLQTLPAPSRLANEVVRRVNIQPRAVDSDQLALRAVVNDSIEDGAIKERNMDTDSVNNSAIQDNAITRLKILDGEVVDGKLDGNSVNRENIKDSAINANKLANASVEESKIVNGAVTNSKIGSGAVRTANIQSSAVTTGTIADSNVTSDKLASGAVTSAKIGFGAVGTTRIADLAVTTAKLADLSVTGAKLANNSVSAAKINVSAVNSIDKITSGVQVAIASNTVTAGVGLRRTVGGSGVAIFASFGGGSQDIPAGNHRHNYQDFGSFGGATTRTTSEPVSSSRSLKKEISPYVIEDPKKILRLDLKKYKYRNQLKDGHTSVKREWLHGYIVEELADLGVEEAVGYDKDGKPISIVYNVLVMYIIEVLKQQEQEISELRKELAKL
jgi:hypothetical protein